MISVNRMLNLVVPVARDDGTTLYIHSMPIGVEVFEMYHLVLAKTFSTFAESGIVVTSAPSIAYMVLKDVATHTARAPGLNWWDGPDGVGGERGLVAEMVRLSNVVVPTKDTGWSTQPLQNALDSGLISEEEKKEVLNLLTFFTVVSRVPPRPDRERLVRSTASLYELLCTSSNVSEYVTSLRTSTTEERTGGNDPA